MGVYLKGITEDVFKEISWECVYLALKRQGRIVEVKEPHGRLIDADALVEIENALNTKVRGVHIMFVDDVKYLAPTVIEGSE